MLCAQQPPGTQSEDGVYTLPENTHLVLMDVTVADKQGHLVAGLTKDDFKLLEDGQPQTIKFFEEHAPVDPAEIARQKAAALAGQTNTFTNYEPFAGRPVTVLLLNQLFPFPPPPSPIPREMLDLHSEIAAGYAVRGLCAGPGAETGAAGDHGSRAVGGENQRARDIEDPAHRLGRGRLTLTPKLRDARGMT